MHYCIYRSTNHKTKPPAYKQTNKPRTHTTIPNYGVPLLPASMLAVGARTLSLRAPWRQRDSPFVTIRIGKSVVQQLLNAIQTVAKEHVKGEVIARHKRASLYWIRIVLDQDVESIVPRVIRKDGIRHCVVGRRQHKMGKGMRPMLSFRPQNRHSNNNYLREMIPRKAHIPPPPPSGNNSKFAALLKKLELEILPSALSKKRAPPFWTIMRRRVTKICVGG